MKNLISKKMGVIILSLIFALSTIQQVFALDSSTVTATPTTSKVIVNGKSVAFDAYNINDNNYFKLRDLAYTLNGTKKQFSVGFDPVNNAISLTSGEKYVIVGGEMSSKGPGTKQAMPTTSKVLLNGQQVNFTTYNIGDNNYFKLRDIAQSFDIGLGWDGATNTITVDSGKSYVPDAGTATPAPKPEPTPAKPQNTGSDPAIVGTWDLYVSSNLGCTYKFNSDGTYTLTIVAGRDYIYFNGSYAASSYETYVTSGNYKASDGVVYCSSVTYTQHTNDTTGKQNEIQYSLKDYSFNYKITQDTDSGKTYLQENYNTDGTRNPITENSAKWVKSN